MLSGEVIDPQQIFVSARHTFHVGQQKVVQRNRLTLPEFMLNGLHDPAAVPLEIVLEGETLPADVTGQDLLDVLGDTSMRSLYSEKFEQKYSSEEVIRALQARLDSGTDLSSFSAKLQAHISDQALKIVDLASQQAKGYSAENCRSMAGENLFMGSLFTAGRKARPVLAYFMRRRGLVAERGTSLRRSGN